jgi:hypothetical protein
VDNECFVGQFWRNGLAIEQVQQCRFFFVGEGFGAV